MIAFRSTSHFVVHVVDGTQLNFDRFFRFIRATPFLDISTKVQSRGEMGLLGLAFHPNYVDEDNGYFFVHYTNRDSNGVIARYRRSQDNVGEEDAVADPDSETILKIIEQPATNHNGGALQFGTNDGMLYIGLGDGGRAYDQAGEQGYGQNLNTYLGKILRVNVSNFELDTWSIPTSGNPFSGTTTSSNALDEIWSYGLRNPWRISFDRLTGDMYIGDVGQNAWEEINFQPASSTGGENYGWCVCEAHALIPASTYSHCAPPSSIDFQGCSGTPSIIGPIIEYPHSQGRSVTGGYVYRGTLYPSLDGTYFYGDFVANFVLGARKQQGGGNEDGGTTSSAWIADALTTSDAIRDLPTTFGEDSCGELYVGTSTGNLYQIKGSDADVVVPTGEFPSSSNSDVPTGDPSPPVSNSDDVPTTAGAGSRVNVAASATAGTLVLSTLLCLVNAH